MAFTPFGSRFKGFNVISSPLEAMRRYDPGTKWINQNPTAAAMMRGVLPVAGGIAGGAVGGPLGAGLGAGLGTWGGEMAFGEGTEDERRRGGRAPAVRNAAAALVLSGLFGALGGGGVETPEGAAPEVTPAATEGGRSFEYMGSGMTPSEYAAIGTPSEFSLQPGPGATPRSATGISPAMSMPSVGGGGYPQFSTNYPAVSPEAAGGGGGSWLSTAGKWAPFVGLNLFSTWQQQQMMEDYQETQEESYDKYLQSLNPPEETKKTRFQGLKGGILAAAPAARKRRSSQMAARGIRGKGAAAPIAETEKDVQDAINQAYFNIYGQYNVPSGAPPVSYTPTTGQMMAGQGTDLANLLMMYNLLGK